MLLSLERAPTTIPHWSYIMTSAADSLRHFRFAPFSFRDLLSALGRVHKRRRSLAILRDLDDRMLKDVGMSRGNLEHALKFGRDLF